MTQVSTTAHTDVLTLLRAHAPTAPPSIRRTVEYLLADPDGAARSTLDTVATAIGCSESTVIRTARHLGFNGYTELRLALARATANPVVDYEAIGQAGSTSELLTLTALASGEAIRGAFAVIDAENFDHAVDAIAVAHRVVCAGVGTSAPLALDVSYRLRMIGIDATFNLDAHMQHADALRLGPGDALLAISHTGRTTETLHILRAAADSGATVVLVTSFFDTPATADAGISLVTGPSNHNGSEGSPASRIAHTALLDALVAAAGRRDPQRSARHLGRWEAAIETHAG